MRIFRIFKYIDNIIHKLTMLEIEIESNRDKIDITQMYFSQKIDEINSKIKYYENISNNTNP